MSAVGVRILDVRQGYDSGASASASSPKAQSGRDAVFLRSASESDLPKL